MLSFVQGKLLFFKNSSDSNRFLSMGFDVECERFPSTILSAQWVHVQVLLTDRAKLSVFAPSFRPLFPRQLTKLGTHTSGRDLGQSSRRPVREQPS